MTHLHSAPYVLAGITTGFITATYGSLPSYLVNNTKKIGGWTEVMQQRGIFKIKPFYNNLFNILCPLKYKDHRCLLQSWEEKRQWVYRWLFYASHWNVCESPETEEKHRWSWSWAIPLPRTVSVLSTIVRLPCWSPHCCFLYWPLLWMVFFPWPCCCPDCLGVNAETRVVLGGAGKHRW